MKKIEICAHINCKGIVDVDELYDDDQYITISFLGYHIFNGVGFRHITDKSNNTLCLPSFQENWFSFDVNFHFMSFFKNHDKFH